MPRGTTQRPAARGFSLRLFVFVYFCFVYVYSPSLSAECPLLSPALVLLGADVAADAPVAEPSKDCKG